MTLSGLSEGKEFLLNLNDNATIVDAFVATDKYIYEHPEESVFPIFNGYIHNYLQLFWNLEENKIYSDVGLMPYGPDEKGDLRKFMPLRDDTEFDLYPNSVIELQLDPGC